jgi:dUTP pyrophosphatase
MRARITRLDPDVPLPAYATPHSAGFDLAANEDLVIEPGAVVLVRTGLVIKTPDGHFLAVIARSSTPIKKGLVLANGVGVIDPDYCGPRDEIRLEFLNITSAPVRIAKGERLAQGLFLPVVRVEWEEGAADDQASRGGFGSTG